jgi:hypothetical protein
LFHSLGCCLHTLLPFFGRDAPERWVRGSPIDARLQPEWPEDFVPDQQDLTEFNASTGQQIISRILGMQTLLAR